jgi:hypothetical protein
MQNSLIFSAHSSCLTDKYYYLLGHDAVQSGRISPTFQKNVLLALVLATYVFLVV